MKELVFLCVVLPIVILLVGWIIKNLIFYNVVPQNAPTFEEMQKHFLTEGHRETYVRRYWNCTSQGGYYNTIHYCSCGRSFSLPWWEDKDYAASGKNFDDEMLNLRTGR